MGRIRPLGQNVQERQEVGWLEGKGSALYTNERLLLLILKDIHEEIILRADIGETGKWRLMKFLRDGGRFSKMEDKQIS